MNFTSQNLCLLTITKYFLPYFAIYFFLINKFIITTLDLQTITDRIITEPTQTSSLFSFKVLLYGILCLPTLKKGKTFKFSIEPLLTFVKINYILLPIISLLYLRRTTMRPLSYKPHGFWGPPRHSSFFLFPYNKITN